MSVFYDLTLRTPGLGVRKKMELAEMIDGIGVSEIEAGRPSESYEERLTVKKIARMGLDAEVYAVCSPSMDDVNEALDCDVDGVVITSPLEELDMALKAVEYAKDHVKVSLSIENPTGVPIRKLISAYRMAADRGLDRIHMSECLGLASYELVECYVTALKEIGCELLCHFRNYIGLATANSVKAIMSGADRVAVSINGIGGNAPLHEVAIALELIYGFYTGLRFERMGAISRVVGGVRCGAVQ